VTFVNFSSIDLTTNTYALVEIAAGNPGFQKFLEKEFVITELTFVEFNAVLLREQGEEVANYWKEKLEPYSAVVELNILIEAVQFRFKHRKTDISFFDAVGYIFALKNVFPFVTGDKEFEHFSGVEFQKGKSYS
jgi:hypothetical protein